MADDEVALFRGWLGTDAHDIKARLDKRFILIPVSQGLARAAGSARNVVPSWRWVNCRITIWNARCRVYEENEPPRGSAHFVLGAGVVNKSKPGQPDTNKTPGD